MLARSRSFASLRMTNLEGDEPLEKEDMQDWRRALEETNFENWFCVLE